MKKKIQNAAQPAAEHPPQIPNGLGCGLGCASVFLGMGVMNLTVLLLYPAVPVWLLVIPLCALLYRKTGKCKPLLYAARGAGITLMLLPFLMTVLIVGFSGTSALHPVRRFIYRKGVVNRPYSAVLMPAHLPENTYDYHLQIRPLFPAQDYKPEALLRLRTDAAWLDTYEAELAAADGLMRIENEPPEFDPEYDEEPEGPQCPQYLPHYLYDTRYITEDLSHAVFYLPQNSDGTPDKSTGAMLNRETGLLIVWI